MNLLKKMLCKVFGHDYVKQRISSRYDDIGYISSAEHYQCKRCPKFMIGTFSLEKIKHD